MKFNVNPQDYSQTYLENLNICFPNWGDMKTFDWVFNRKVTNRKADFFIINSEENELLAGSAISYRKLKFPSGNDHEIGIMTGSWTLPISRGMGCFTETIKKSVEIVQDKKVSFLTAFVTESNASYRRLRDAGSFLVDTNYIISQNLECKKLFNQIEVAVLECNYENLEAVFNLRNKLLQSKIHYDYNFDEFVNQFINRINPTFLIQLGNEFAIVEETPKMFQLHYCTSYSYEIITGIVNWVNKKNKEIIFFSTDKNNSFQNDESFKVIPGFFTILKNEVSNNVDLNSVFSSEIDFDIQYGDKM
jgi:hypothetical protein